MISRFIQKFLNTDALLEYSMTPFSSHAQVFVESDVDC